MSEFDEIRNRIERETEKKYPGYHGPRSGEWTPGRRSLLDGPVVRFRKAREQRIGDGSSKPAAEGTVTVLWL